MSPTILSQLSTPFLPFESQELTDCLLVPFSKFHLSIGRKVVEVHHDYRLYPDEYHGFLFGSMRDIIKGGWSLTKTSSFPINDPPPQLIPVPLSTLPLSGTRFGLKDIYDAKGLPTAAGSLDYVQTQEIPTETALHREVPPTGRSPRVLHPNSAFAHSAHSREFRDVLYSWKFA